MKLLAVVHPDYSSSDALFTRIDIQEVPVPFAMLEVAVDLDSKLDDDMVLVKKTAFSINYRDKGICLRAYREIQESGSLSSYFTIGSEFAGVVVRVGSAVHQFKPGDRVMPDHAFPHSGYKHVLPGVISNKCSSEYAVYHFSKLIQIPDNMTDETAASFSLGAQTAYSMVRKAVLLPGQRALVTAASSNTSLFIIQTLIARGIETHVITTQREYTEAFKKIGVHTVYHNNTSFDFYDERQDMAHINDRFDAVFDPLFDIYFVSVVPLLNMGAKYLTCGRYDQFSGIDGEPDERYDQDIKVTELIGYILHNNISLIGNCIGFSSDLEQAVKDYEEGKLPVLIDSVFRNGDINGFMTRSFSEKKRLGKVIYSYQ